MRAFVHTYVGGYLGKEYAYQEHGKILEVFIRFPTEAATEQAIAGWSGFAYGVAVIAELKSETEVLFSWAILRG